MIDDATRKRQDAQMRRRDATFDAQDRGQIPKFKENRKPGRVNLTVGRERLPSEGFSSDRDPRTGYAK